MADITMCKGGNCFRKNTCYRFTAKPNEYRQSYFMNIPVNVLKDSDGEETQQCDELMVDWDAMTKLIEK